MFQIANVSGITTLKYPELIINDGNDPSYSSDAVIIMLCYALKLKGGFLFLAVGA